MQLRRLWRRLRNEYQYCFGRSGARDKAAAFILIPSADDRIGWVTTRDVTMAAFGGTIFATFIAAVYRPVPST